MPDHHSPTLVAQQVRTKLLRKSLAPLSESRNPMVHQPKPCWRFSHSHASACRARSRSLILAMRCPSTKELIFLDHSFVASPLGVIWYRGGFVSKAARSMFNGQCDRRGYGVN